MQDLYLKAPTEADMTTALLAAGIIAATYHTPVSYVFDGVTYADRDDLPWEVVVPPADWVDDGDDLPPGALFATSTDDVATYYGLPGGGDYEVVYGEPVVTGYVAAPFVTVDHIGINVERFGTEDWHTNLYAPAFTDDQMATLAPLMVTPDQPFRVRAK